MDMYMEAHVYMLQTRAQHYQFEIALVTHVHMFLQRSQLIQQR